MKKVISILFGVVVLSVFSSTGYVLYSKTNDVPSMYDTETPFVTSITSKTVASGKVTPRREVALKPQVSGIVDELFVEAGQRVRSGDPVARIRIVPDPVQLSAAENRLAMARIDFRHVEREVERVRALHRERLVSDTDLRDRERALSAARQELQAAQENLELIANGATAESGATDNRIVRATIDGTVLELNVDVGDSVTGVNQLSKADPIATVADLDDLVFEGWIDESEVSRLRPGMKLELTIGAIENETFEATLESIAPKGEESNGTIQFEIRAALASTGDSFVRANYSASADVVIERREDVLAVGEHLLQFDDERTYVEVEVAPQVFERRDLETGLSNGVEVEVIAGLTEGSRIKNPNRVLE